MSTKPKAYSAEEKVAIIQEGIASTVTQTCRKYTISPTTYYQWRDKFDVGGIDALRVQKSAVDPELHRLQKENERLKRLLAEKELTISIKDELLKKTSFRISTAVRSPV
jgi:putative transposase